MISLPTASQRIAVACAALLLAGCSILATPKDTPTPAQTGAGAAANKEAAKPAGEKA